MEYRIAFGKIKGMNSDLAQKILDIIPSEKDFFLLSEKDLMRMLDTKNKIFGSLYRTDILNKAHREIEFINKNNIDVHYFTDSDFPVRLLNASDAPIIFFTKGKTDLNAAKIISVVGTRHATPYGQHFCETFIKDIAQEYPDTIIVSGLAYGIDIAAHREAVAANLPTVAVLAHGLNTIYPAPHRSVAIDILNSGGMILTDYLSQDAIHRSNFLARNRIVAALCDCLVVVESGVKGGALVTAGIAASYDRDVFALPGRTSDTFSQGCNNLIRHNAASLITCAEDLIMSMRWERHNYKSPLQIELFPKLSSQEQKIVDILTSHSELHVNTMCSLLNMPISQLLSLLVDMEFNGVLLSLPGGKYSLA